MPKTNIDLSNALTEVHALLAAMMDRVISTREMACDARTDQTQVPRAIAELALTMAALSAAPAIRNAVRIAFDQDREARDELDRQFVRATAVADDGPANG